MQFHRKVTLAHTLAVTLAVAAFAAAPALAPLHAQDAQQDGGWRHGRGGMDRMGRGVEGTVTEAAGDHFVVKNEAGQLYTVHFSANTRILKQVPHPAGAQAEDNDSQPSSGEMRGGGRHGSRTPPTPIQAGDIKVGDAILAAGEIDDSAKSVGAVMILKLDPESVQRMREMRASFGKTWLMGRVTAIDAPTVTLESQVDNAAHSFTADENTDFRRRRAPITLGDIQVGDTVRVTGAVKNGVFIAANVAVMGGRPNGGQGGPGAGPAPQ